jgi:hypothetical protein
VFVTKDFGETWTSITSNLPAGNVNVITADPRNRNLLFLGTEYALYVSLNGGKEWQPFMQGLPTVRVDDIIVHPREHDLIAGTHGRSIWIVDDISALEQMNDQTTQGDAYVFDVRPATAWINDIQRQITVGGQKHFRGQNPDPGTAISYWLKNAATSVQIAITDISGNTIRTIEGTKSAGLNRVQWNLQRGSAPPANTGRAERPAGGQGERGATPAAQGAGGGGGGGRGRGGFGGPAVAAGTYLVKVTVDGKEIGKKTVMVEPDSLQ